MNNFRPYSSRAMQSNCREQRPYQFFKIFLPSKTRDEKLKFPPKLVKIFRDEVPASASLTTPVGHVWPVRLEKGSDNSCFISDGWKEFAEHHAIGYGYFLVFGYEGASNFRVSVFDLTACEIRYPCNPSIGSQNPYHGKHSSVHPKQEEMQDDVSVEILGSSPPWHAPNSFKDGIFEKIHRRGSNALGIKKHGKFKHGCFRGSKNHKFEDHLEATRVDHLNRWRWRSSSSSSGKTTDSEDSLIKHRKKQKANARTRTLGKTENREKIIHSARMLNPANPSFTAIIKPYNNRLLYVPAEFAKKYLRRRSIKLLDSTGKLWPLTCLINLSKNVRLSRGWHEFIKEKHLKEGDVCVFELVQRGNVVLKVFIFQQ